VSRAFRLAGLLRLRGLAEEQAAARLAGATRTRDDATARRTATEAALGAARFPEGPDGTDGLGMQAVVASRMALSALLVDQRARVVVTQDAVDAADADWSAARTRTRTLEKLQEKHEAVVQVEEQRAEQVVLDEIAGRRGATGPTLPGEPAPVAGEAR
jgi:flagellar FliJ protein